MGSGYSSYHQSVRMPPTVLKAINAREVSKDYLIIMHSAYLPWSINTPLSSTFVHVPKGIENQYILKYQT